MGYPSFDQMTNVMAKKIRVPQICMIQNEKIVQHLGALNAIYG